MVKVRLNEANGKVRLNWSKRPPPHQTQRRATLSFDSSCFSDFLSSRSHCRELGKQQLVNFNNLCCKLTKFVNFAEESSVVQMMSGLRRKTCKIEMATNMNHMIWRSLYMCWQMVWKNNIVIICIKQACSYYILLHVLY